MFHCLLLLIIQEKYKDGWWLVQKETTNEEGLVPGSYCQDIERDDVATTVDAGNSKRMSSAVVKYDFQANEKNQITVKTDDRLVVVVRACVRHTQEEFGVRIVVRCGVVWCDVLWCGMVQCVVLWCGVVRSGVLWCGAVRMVWCGVMWCGGCPIGN